MATPRAERREEGSTGRYSLVDIRDQWYIACRSHELRDRPRQVEILGTPLVLFRGPGGAPTALLDRCAHRNVPLSLGRVVEGQVECPYHGWRFDTEGTCRLVPALCGPQEGRARRVPRYEVREQQGLVWVYMEPDTQPTKAPYRVPLTDQRGYVRVDYSGDFHATLHATLENILDVPHTAFLHRGLFRSAKRNRIEVVVRRTDTRVEAEFIGEPAPRGLIGRVLAPRGEPVIHFDRFLLPSIAQVEYRLGNNHILITDILTPVSDFVTRMNAVVMARLPLGGVLKHVLRPVAGAILQQDAKILKIQTDHVRRFGGEQFVSTPVDLLGPHILRLLRQAERREAGVGGEPVEQRLEMLA